MSLLLSCQSLSKSYGNRILFDDLSFSVFSQDKIGLIGPNGSGKSTLLKIIVKIEESDSGALAAQKDLKIGYVPQSCEFSEARPLEILFDALKGEVDMADFEKERLARTWLSKLGFETPDLSASLLSGGWKKRLGFACALITSPNLLLIDEPTNHLDLEGILWLEKFLEREAPPYLVVSHDRYFLQNTTNRIIEIDRAYPKGIFAIEGPYSYFLEKKKEFLEGELQRERSLASKARHESEWLAKSPKARTTKSQARVDETLRLLDELSDIRIRNRPGRTDIDFEATERETRRLLVAKNLSKEMKGRPLFRNLDFTLSPGTRIGLMGPNGSGKTTLLRLIADEISPERGTIKRADALKIVYFDQHRAQLPGHLTLRGALAPNGDYVTFRGTKVHINGWCKRFLFSPDILDMPLERLSGGERARISIAHLMLQPADLLLLDEPTNDLDIPTLETLEDSLMDFPGAIILITHDRCMIDRICNTVLALGDPDHTAFFASYGQWEAAQKAASSMQKKQEKSEEPKPLAAKTKLSYLEKREYEQMEEKISKLEKEVQKLNHLLEEAEVVQDQKRLTEICAAVGLAENQIEQLYLRWEELERKLLGN